MKLIASATDLQDRFTELLSRCQSVRIGVAWMRDGYAVSKLLESQRPFKAVIGTDFGATDPHMVKRLWERTKPRDNLRLFTSTGGVFHPKLYLFEMQTGWEALIGSANMTAGAFAENIETMVSLRLKDHHARYWLDVWEGWWNACDRFNHHRLSEYEGQAAKWAQAPVHRLAQRADLINRSSHPSDKSPSKREKHVPKLASLHSLSFPKYIALLREQLRNEYENDDNLDSADRGYSNYLSVIERSHDIIGQDGFPSPTDSDRFGLVLGRRQDTGWLGSLRGLRGGWNELKKPAFIAQIRSKVRPLLSSTSEPDLLRHGRALFELIVSRDGLSNGVATRLLALARPDRFFSLNNKSSQNLSQLFGVPVTELKVWAGYEAGLRVLWTAEWFHSTEPQQSLMARLWRVRVALIDAAVARA